MNAVIQKKQKQPILIIVLLLWASVLQAQLVKGIIQDEEERPLINATIYKSGQISEGYSITSYDGRFEIQAAFGDTLVISCIGYETQNVVVESRTPLITLIQENIKDDVIVVGLGLSRSEKELGYSIQDLKEDDIAYSRTHNYMHALQGRLVGVDIKSSSAGPSSAVSMVIRGGAGWAKAGQPLVVLNGMAINNELFSYSDGLNGSSTIDFGNASQFISIDDIQSISILKSAASAIAYGERAANGVMLITTKNGLGGKEGWSVKFNSSTSFETPLKMPDYQNKYGAGGYGKYTYLNGRTTAGEYYDALGENWGPRLNGQLVKQWNSNGEAVPYSANPTNIQDFYRVGIKTINNIALSNLGKNSDFRLSFSSMYKSDIVPNSDLYSSNIVATFGQNIGKKVKLRANVMYTLRGSKNIPGAGYDESSSILYGWFRFPRNANIKDFQEYWKIGKENEEQRYAEELGANNPYMIVNENTNSFLEHDFNADMALDIDLHKFVKGKIRANADLHRAERYYKRALSTRGAANGSYEQSYANLLAVNAQAHLNSFSNPEKPFKIAHTLVASMERLSEEYTTTKAPQLGAPGVYNLNNARDNLLTDDYKSRRVLYGLYSTVDLSYKSIIHVELSTRVDWPSTLPVGSFLGGYNYNAASLSFVVSELFNLPAKSPLNMLKLRAAYGHVEREIPPYSINNTYVYGNTWQQNNLLSNNSKLNNTVFKPANKREVEGGLDLRLFNNRLIFNTTAYYNRSSNLILDIPLPISTGYQFKTFSEGFSENTGVELELYVEPIRQENTSWLIAASTAWNRNKALSFRNAKQLPIVADLFPSDGESDLSLVAEVGKPLGQLHGLVFQRDDQGNIIHKDGLPLMTTKRTSIGSYRAEWQLGLENRVRVHNWSFSMLWNGQIGGKIYSRSHAMLNRGGSITNYNDPHLDMSTLDGRIEYDISYDGNGNPIYTLVNQGGVVGKGVMYDGNGNLVENTVSVPTRDYFQAYYNKSNIEAATYDATYFKLRELRISYSIPQYLLKKVNIENITISLFGRNLALISAVPSIDPETFSIRANRIVQGFESGQLPPTRSFGINLNIEF